MVFKEVLLCLAALFAYVEGQTCVGGSPSTSSLVGKTYYIAPQTGYSYLDSSTTGVFNSAGVVTRFEFYVNKATEIHLQCWRPHQSPPDMLQLYSQQHITSGPGQVQVTVNWPVEDKDRCGFYFPSESTVPIPYESDQSHYSFQHDGTQSVNTLKEFQFNSGEAYKKFMFQYCYTSDSTSPPVTNAPTPPPSTGSSSVCYGPDVTASSRTEFSTGTTAPMSHVNNFGDDVITAAATIRIIRFYAHNTGTIKFQLFTPVQAPASFTLKNEQEFVITSTGVQTVSVNFNAAPNDRIGFTQTGSATQSLVLQYKRQGDAYSSIQTNPSFFPGSLGSTATYDNPKEERFPFMFCTGDPVSVPPTAPPTTKAPPTGLLAACLLFTLCYGEGICTLAK